MVNESITDHLIRKKSIRGKKYVPLQPEFERYTSNYRYLAESHPLHGMIAEFYQIENSSVNKNQLLGIPDGCFDIIFSFDGITSKAYFCGNIQTVSNLQVEAKDTIFGVRFMPGGSSRLFHSSAKNLSENITPLHILLPSSRNLPEKIAAATDFNERIEIMLQLFNENLLEKSGKLNLMDYCTNRIAVTKGKISMKQLSEETGYSNRYISKIFEDFVGISPKNLSEIHRLQYCLYMMFYDPEKSLTYISTEAGFYDQAHMNRKFLKYLKMNPNYIKSGNFGT